ncbi:adenine-specific DNA-methyltransferase [Halobacillus karajensis]|uniref:Eco57I restriction-modification methylase domain-containing protein n=1 Tax=Halobacillus karajensis TaxID=195088 RepID=UPI0008A77DA9|nr:class I SAM-dependent methyltransferase [Halobacillus karajensis]SEI13419.1 adenine-specific DNA-methyltransferase [Halobacillus karajensis]
MKLLDENTAQKLRGGYYTPEVLADFITYWAFHDGEKNKILEPSCGDGSFIKSLTENYQDDFNNCLAVELFEEEADKVRALTRDNDKVKVKNGDFFSEYNYNLKNERFDLIIGNPPYIRYQYLTPEQRETQSNILTTNGMKSNKLINAWVSFLVASVELLEENGKIGMVIPAELLQVAYAADLRLFLEKNLSKITVITYEQLVFPDVQQEVVLLLGEKGSVEENEQNKITVVELENSETTFEEVRNTAVDYKPVDITKDKWTKYFLSNTEIGAVHSVINSDNFVTFNDIAKVDIGITTGNNKFFSVTKETVEKFDLSETTLPLIGRSAHAHGIFYTEDDWEFNVNKGLPAQLAQFPNEQITHFPEGYKQYIKEAEENGQSKGYKLGLRKYWYHIPSVYPPDAFFLRRNDSFPKFVLNDINAVSTDTMHRIRFYEGINSRKALLSYYNSITLAFTEMEGRSYGGGVLEVLPGEVEKIVLPNLNDLDDEVTERLLEYVDHSIRNDGNTDDMLDRIDREVLINYLGLDEDTVLIFRNIWRKLMHRRNQRKKIKKSNKK